MLSVHYLVSPGLGDLTAGALLLVTLCFAAVNSIPGCTLAWILGPWTTYRTAFLQGDLGWSCGGASHANQKSRLKHPCYCISRLDLELGGTWSDCAQPAHASGVDG